MNKLKTISKKQVETEIVEKKSRFIANIFYIENTNQAEEKIKEIKKKYFDARHNCYAYRVLEEKQITQKSSDDGEPAGTAGAPILNVLEKNNIINTVVIITRYFGGILLGTGGLVKAYSESTIKGINEAEIIEIEEGYEIKLTISYSDFDTFKYFCNKEKIEIEKEEYLENINVFVNIPERKLEKIETGYEKNGFKIKKMEKITKKLIRKYA